MNLKNLVRDNWSIAIYVAAFLLKGNAADWIAVLILIVAIVVDLSTTERGKSLLRDKLLKAEAFLRMGSATALDAVASGVGKAGDVLDRIGKRLEKEADEVKE